jgi:hypothetical protein
VVVGVLVFRVLWSSNTCISYSVLA